MKNFIKKIVDTFQTLQSNLKQLVSLNKSLKNYQHSIGELMFDDYLQKYLYENPKYADPKKLNKFEFKVYSQAGEDGIISEIFQRIGTTNKYFVEFGVGNGLENNTCYLLIKGWQGYWIEGSTSYCKAIYKKFTNLIADGQLQLKNTFISAENIEALFREAQVPVELDLLCIDIDGNDYWVWKAIDSYRPRVVSIEYNAIYPPEVSWVMKYNPNHQWDYSSYMGSSLKALELLGKQKGYKLVGCSFSGVNAFLVREDLVGDLFCEPYTAENHYESAKYFLCWHLKGHPRSFGEFENFSS